MPIWNNGHILGVEETFYDDSLIKTAKKLHDEQRQKDFMPSARLIGEVIGNLPQYHVDAFLNIVSDN
ncbi:DUF3658 domain-containing protein [Niallia nealsonii]|uniref:DUF3658 domain-containing protein n=1 Tax=Niallia nealsonii TaxID=115979 RepID=A0A2N0Z1S3_9BACI|nr:DUF3658 domain-containing protein [Niallia nealsonii]PKG23460.1 hypothetical protein CWS01_11780 [Niallia nealsonii]